VLSITNQNPSYITGVWKLTPSSPTTQPSSSGKKVSLLLPGTVATEPTHNAVPHQPNTAVKQPGMNFYQKIFSNLFFFVSKGK